MKFKLFVVIILINLSSHVFAQIKESELQSDENLYSAERILDTDSDAIPSQAISLNNQGVELTLAKKYDEALAEFRQAIKIAPVSRVIKRNLTETLIRAKHFDEAIELCQQIINADKDAVDGHFYKLLGASFYETGNFAESANAYRQALKSDQDNVKLLNDLGIALYQTKDYQAALTTLQNVLKIKPDFADALNNYGVTLIALGQYEEAVRQLKKSIEAQPEYALAQNNLGMAYSYLGKKNQAQKHYLEAIRLKPDWGHPHYNLAVDYLKQGKRDTAWHHLNVLRKLDVDLAVNLQERFSKQFVINAAEVR